jgi:sigma-B regulation protein RsbQ
MWRFVAPAFEDAWQVVRFDHAGAGAAGTDAYDPVRHATLQGYSDDVLELLEALDLRGAVLVGHSVGATIAMLAAAAAPARVDALVLVAPSPCYLDDPPDYHGGFSRADLDGLLDLMCQNYVAWADALAPTVIGSAHAEAPGAAPERERELHESFCAMDADVAVAFARATFLEDHRATVARVPVPSLILQCRDDAIAPPTVGAWMAAHMPRATLHQLAATGHCPHMTHPDETIAAMQAYLRAYLPASPAAAAASG